MGDSGDSIAPRGTPFNPGMVISGKFVLLRVIGVGAMSSVYEAKDSLIGRHVALKILHPHLTASTEIVRRFRREAEAMARIQHPNVVMVHEMGQRRDGTFFIIQELLAGENLRAYLDAHGRLSVDEAIEIMLPIMGALCAAHSHGIIHRDVKPENIVLTRSVSGDLIPKLVDFGIAKLHSLTGKSLTNLGSILGTIQYMSPEQASGTHGIDARSDVWAVGVVLFELCAGICPFDGPSIQAVLARLLTQRAQRLDAVALDTPKELADILQRALDHDLSRRFPTMQAFRDELMVFAGGRPRPSSRLTGRLLIDDASTAPLPESERAEARAGSPAGQGDLWIEDTVPVSGEWIEADDLISVDNTPTDGLPQAIAKAPLHGRHMPNHSGPDWSVDVLAAPPYPENQHAAAADQALRVNNLSEAIEHAENALEVAGEDASVAGRMWLVKASAHRWLGSYVEADRCAREAATRLPNGDGSWYAALAYIVIANGYLSRREPLEAILEEVNRQEVTRARINVHTILLCRIAIFLVRTGAPDVAQHIVADIWLRQGLSPDAEISDAIVQAWLDLARAELATHNGDVATHLRRIESAVDSFTAAGALRDACLQQSNIGNAYMQLGAHRRAVAVLKESLDVAEPMRLGLVGVVKANLGFALAHLNQLDQALTMEEEALRHSQKQNNKRGVAIAWIYLAAIYSMRDELPEATSAAEQAIHVGGAGPAMRACAFAMLARMLLEQQRPAPALKHAEEAMRLLERLGGVEEGESLIRWVHALALRNNGQEPEGRKRIAEARNRLLERANRINEPHWRQSFLLGVRDNDRLLQLAEQWIGS